MNKEIMANMAINVLFMNGNRENEKQLLIYLLIYFQ